MDELLWSRDAINCYELNCDCSKCLLAKILETPCILNLTVEKNLKIIGKPTEENTQKDRKPHRFYNKRISKYDIINKLKTTTKTKAAEYFGINIQEMSELMKAYGINGHLLRGERNKK